MPDLVATEAQQRRIRASEESEAFADESRSFNWKILEALKEKIAERWAVCPSHGQRSESGISGSGQCLARVGKRACLEPCPRNGQLKMSGRELSAASEKCSKAAVTPELVAHAMGLGRRPIQNLTVNQDNRTLLVDLKDAPAEVQAWHIEREKRRVLGAAAGGEELPALVL